MKRLKQLLYLTVLVFASNMMHGQWVVTPSTPVSSYSQPVWKVDTALNDNYMAITYGNQSPGGAGATVTSLKIFNSNSVAITGDITVFNVGSQKSRVAISNDNFVYV